MATGHEPDSRWAQLDKFRKPLRTYNTRPLEVIAMIIMIILLVIGGAIYLLLDNAGDPRLDPVYHKIHDALPDVEGPLHSDHDDHP